MFIRYSQIQKKEEKLVRKKKHKSNVDTIIKILSYVWYVLLVTIERITSAIVFRLLIVMLNLNDLPI